MARTKILDLIKVNYLKILSLIVLFLFLQFSIRFDNGSDIAYKLTFVFTQVLIAYIIIIIFTKTFKAIKTKTDQQNKPKGKLNE